ncbi:MAG TPA: hypothetical protein VM694_33865, partial [Polyangium sp.]|nr:hypothetical protein [Polyangium sp.]
GAPLNRAEAILRKSARAQTTIEEAFLRELRGDHAAVVQGESSAEGAYHVALDAYAETGDERGKGRVLGKLARIAKRRDEAEVAARRFEEALALADALGDVSLRAALLLARGAGVEGKKDSPEALADLDRAIALFESIGDEQGRARALLARTRVRHGHDDIEGATADVEAALAILGRIDDPVARLSALSEKVDVYVNHHNKPDQAEAMLLEARQIASRIGDRMARGWCLYTLGRLRKGRRDWTGAYKAFDEADTCFRQGDKEGWRVHAILQKSQLCHDTGRMDAAFVHSSEALAISRRMTSALRRTYQILKWHAHMLMHRDEHDRALELMDESIKDAEGEGKHTLAEVWSERAALRAAQGDLEGAWADFEKALAVDPQWHCQAPVRLRRADAFLRYFTFGEPVMGATDEAMDSLVRRVTVDLDGLIEGSDGNAREETAAEARVIRSMYLLLLDEPSRAVVDVEAAIAWFHASDKQSEEARALLRLTEIHLRHDGPGAADESLRRAAAIVQALGDEALSVQVSFFRVSVAGARGDFEEALQVLQQMRKGKQRLTPGFLEATMAQIHFRRGYITGARRYAERAMEQASKDTRAVISLMLQELLEPAKAPGTPRKA